MKRLLNDCRDPYFNLALEEYFLKETDEDVFMLWRDESAVVCGRNQNIFAEADVPEAEERGIRLCRRYSGGGTVYHDIGNVNYTYILNYGGELDYGRFVSPVLGALIGMGIPAEMTGSGDITVCGKKVSGNAQARIGGRLLHHGTLLFDSELGVLNSVTGTERRPANSISSKSVRSRVSEVADIKEYKNITTDEFERLLAEALCAEMEERPITDGERETVSKLSREKYSTWDWIFGYSPKFVFDDGETVFTVRNGRIAEIGAGLPDSFIGARLERRELESLGLDEKSAKHMISGK